MDTFVHTWIPNDDVESKKIWNDMEKLYSPISFFMDNPIPENTNSDMFVPNASHPANFCTSMFYSIYKSNELLNEHSLFTGTKYDFVVRSRFDLALNKIIDFSSLEKNVLYVSKDIEGPSLLNDQFAIADTSTMNVYASTFLFLRRLHDSGVPLCGHEMLQEHLTRNGIIIKKIDIDHPFVDGLYNRGRHSIVRDDMHKWVDPKIWGY